MRENYLTNCQVPTYSLAAGAEKTRKLNQSDLTGTPGTHPVWGRPASLRLERQEEKSAPSGQRWARFLQLGTLLVSAGVRKARKRQRPQPRHNHERLEPNMLHTERNLAKTLSLT